MKRLAFIISLCCAISLASFAQRDSRAYIAYNDSIDWNAVYQCGARLCTTTKGIATAIVPTDSIAALRKVKGVKYVQVSSAVHQQMDLARKDGNVDMVHSGAHLPSAYTGKGVVIGIVDAGIDYTHPAFRDSKGALRIKKVWEQGTASSAYGSTPTEGYGTEFTSENAIRNAGGDSEGGSHGTHVLGIASGKSTAWAGRISPDYKGVAPDADLIVVALSTEGGTGADNVCVSDAISYIYRYADEVGKPCVINLSLGSHIGPHDGTSLFDVYADNVQGPGRIIVGAAGNYGSYKFHLQKDFASKDDAPVQTFVKFQNAPSTSNKGGEIDIWGSVGTDFEVSLIAYSTFNHEVKDEVKLTESQSGLSISRNISGTVDVTVETSPLNGKKHINIASAITNLRSNYQLALKVTPLSAGRVDVWSDHAKFDLASLDEEGFTEPTNEATITEIGGTGKRIITVGAYITRDTYILEGETTPHPVGENLNELYSFSGFGPTADGRTKPDVCAPGGIIISSISSFDKSGTELKAFSYTYEGKTYSYGYLHGTSMSAPYVTGTIATWLEANPSLTPEQVREVLQQTSRDDSFTGIIPEEGDRKWGFGKIDAYAGCQAVLSYTGINDITTSAPSASNAWYDLQGRRVQNTSAHKGIYINNGLKVIR